MDAEYSSQRLGVGVWVGIIALAGLDAETVVVKPFYLDLACERQTKDGKMRNADDLRDAIYHGAVQRVRPKARTARVIIAGLMPILWSHAHGITRLSQRFASSGGPADFLKIRQVTR